MNMMSTQATATTTTAAINKQYSHVKQTGQASILSLLAKSISGQIVIR